MNNSINKKLRDQVAVITGANSGIGAGIAKAIAGEGALVIINYPFDAVKDEAIALQTEIINSGDKAAIYRADVSSEKEVIAMFSSTVKEHGTVDILINNAGIQIDSSFTEMTLDDWNKVLSVNLTGQFLCAREAAKEFIRRGIVPERSCAAGKIICISSVHEEIPWAKHVNYATSKGGIMMMMKSIAQELAPKKIRVNSIAPGAIKTPINYTAWNTPEAEKNLLTLIPYGRVGETGDIGRAAVWLASDESDYINGTSIFIDGGMTLYPGFSTNG
jgi:glucose 1-dehydrogenase